MSKSKRQKVAWNGGGLSLDRVTVADTVLMERSVASEQ